ncbi:MAG: hypothetical protein QXF82_10325 [Nitrososphaeria archaeon]
MTKWRKEYNRKLSKARVTVEYTICIMKKLEYARRVQEQTEKVWYDIMTDIVSGIVNLW